MSERSATAKMKALSLLRRLKAAIRGFAAAPAPRARTDIGNGGYFYLGPNLALTRLNDGHHLYVDPQDESVGIHLIARGRWEDWVYKVAIALVSEGDHVIEVGANFGYYSVGMALKAGPHGSVTALEANPALADYLKRSVNFNGYNKRIFVVQKAASDVNGTVQFTSSPRNAGGGHLFIEHAHLGPDTKVYNVETVKLDDLDTPAPKLIRIDAEGSEPLILRGAERLLRRPDICVCMEWDVLQMSSRSDVPSLIDWLTGLGFRFWRIGPDSSLNLTQSEQLPGLPACDIVMARSRPFSTE